jgi:threonine-phosphate decarboxylase
VIVGHGGNIGEVARQIGCRPSEIIDMSSNVNPLGPPPGLLAHLRQHLEAILALPEVDSGQMVKAFARRHDLPADAVLAGNGTTQLIYALPRALDTRRALILGPTYADYADACRMQGIAPAFCMAREAERFQPDLELLVKAAADADTVFVCNPNNPTGTLIPSAELERCCRRHPAVRFIIDESYLPFAPPAAAKSLMGCGLQNVVVLNSMSKIFRIPGLRIGFAVSGPGTIDRLRQLALPWSVNSLAQAAVQYLMARPAETDAFVAETRQHLEAEKSAFKRALGTAAHLQPYPSATSFILIRLEGGLTAAAVRRRLARRRILIRDCANFEGLSERFIRISLKERETNRHLGRLLQELA